jgi:hypothetical protein
MQTALPICSLSPAAKRMIRGAHFGGERHEHRPHIIISRRKRATGTGMLVALSSHRLCVQTPFPGHRPSLRCYDD